MRTILYALCAFVMVAAADVQAAPKKKPTPAAKKTPPGGVPATPAPAPEAAPATADSGGAPAMRGPTRIDFDDRLIQGQTNKSGAVYLYDRKELKIRSMIKKRDNFRDEIVGGLYDS